MIELFAKTTKEEDDYINVIVRRITDDNPDYDPIDLRMDLTATHRTTALNFKKLAEADDFNLFHDVYGIRKYMNRTTGKLTNCFLPRCTK